MTKETAVKLFNEKQVRCQWDDEQGKWYFSIVDIIESTLKSPIFWNDEKMEYWESPLFQHSIIPVNKEFTFRSRLTLANVKFECPSGSDDENQSALIVWGQSGSIIKNISTNEKIVL
ncbi:MAG: hypothetical protein HY958_11090 [Bacteroidia bacterium]|nr:hypothetical protein [Bacteroidia bacterium]